MHTFIFTKFCHMMGLRIQGLRIKIAFYIVWKSISLYHWEFSIRTPFVVFVGENTEDNFSIQMSGEK